MTDIICSKCKSSSVVRKSYATKIGATVGFIGGPVGTAVGITVGSAAGAILAGLKGIAAGSAIGAGAGKVLDDTVINAYKCNQCSHVFTV
ncbi:hypothetical protein [Spirochaeta dissipatitropha]